MELTHTLESIKNDLLKEGYVLLSDCWKNSSKLTVHHIDYDKQNCSPTNLITLCNSCNARANFNRNYWNRLYKDLIGTKGGSLTTLQNLSFNAWKRVRRLNYQINASVCAV